MKKPKPNKPLAKEKCPACGGEVEEGLVHCVRCIQKSLRDTGDLPKDPTPRTMELPEQLHIWYLEATSKIHKLNYNPHAHKPYSELNDEQKFIDKYIADALREWIRGKIEECLKDNDSDTHIVADDLLKVLGGE